MKQKSKALPQLKTLAPPVFPVVSGQNIVFRAGIAAKDKGKCRNRPFSVPASRLSWVQSGDRSCSFSLPLNPTLSWISNGAFLCQSASLDWIAMWIFPAGNPALSTLTWHTYTVSWLPKTLAHLSEWHCAHFPSSLAIFSKALLSNDD